MQRRTALLHLTSAVALSGCASPSRERSQTHLDLSYLTPEVKVDLYLRAASELQSLGRKAALVNLKSMAQGFAYEYQLIVLCRMLFAPRRGSEFRRPGLGGAVFLGDTDYVDWPLEPIELVDDIPFDITRGYVLFGMPEWAHLYIRYCEESCDWGSTLYSVKTSTQRQGALSKLLASPKWRRPLEGAEIQFLSDQIQ
jgi:hypothetical protein